MGGSSKEKGLTAWGKNIQKYYGEKKIIRGDLQKCIILQGPDIEVLVRLEGRKK